MSGNHVSKKKQGKKAAVRKDDNYPFPHCASCILYFALPTLLRWDETIGDEDED
ncbi:MAG: hypothetical protein IPI64_02380 [Chloracidobacterium sp.]|nr:hypothetical protein [Chloracidobacterium sp.]